MEEGLRYDSKNTINEHISHVRTYLFKVMSEIMMRSANHDNSMMDPEEKRYLDEFIPVLSQNEPGSPEHKAALDQMLSGRDHHFQKNNHHLEHYGSLSGMDLLDLIEWVCDQKAASMQDGNRNIVDRLNLYFKKYDFPVELIDMIHNTVKRYFIEKDANGNQ